MIVFPDLVDCIHGGSLSSNQTICFVEVSVNISRAAASSYCSSLGGSLAALHNDELLRFVRNSVILEENG